jgi:S-adenosylmethionine synthetase
MARKRWLFTSESVAAGHPDKVADRISDEILDACIRLTPSARVAVETLVTDGLVVMAGEVSGATVDYGGVAGKAINDLGYDDLDARFSSGARMEISVHQQAAEIGAAVDREGAGDQGIMFGFACDEAPEFMPAPIYYAHRIVEAVQQFRRSGNEGLGPDGKSQVTLEYLDGKPVRADTVIVSQMHAARLSQGDVCDLVKPVIRRVLPEGWVDANTKVLINPAGSFVAGGPAADTGLTGRKIIVDAYGSAAPHGGGAFSGKDPTKVDRAGAYAARYLAKNVVAAGLAERCLVQIAYAIGVAEPVAFSMDCQGTAKVPEEEIETALRQCMPLTPRSIREQLGLNKAIYARTAAYGHFGRAPDADGGFSWEKTDLVEAISRSV